MILIIKIHFLFATDNKELNKNALKYNYKKYIIEWDWDKDIQYMRKHKMLSKKDEKELMKEGVNMFSNFLEGDSTQEVPEEVKVKKEVDYAPLGEPITGDPIKDLPHEKQPDYVPSGYEEGDPKDNCTSCKEFASNFEEEIHESVAEWHDEYSNKIIGGSFSFK